MCRSVSSDTVSPVTLWPAFYLVVCCTVLVLGITVMGIISVTLLVCGIAVSGGNSAVQTVCGTDRMCDASRGTCLLSLCSCSQEVSTIYTITTILLTLSRVYVYLPCV